LISEITESFREEDKGALNQGLKENYLLGYYLQRTELNNTEKREDMKNEQLAEQD
jgi:hypothetical protein